MLFSLVCVLRMFFLFSLVLLCLSIGTFHKKCLFFESVAESISVSSTAIVWLFKEELKRGIGKWQEVYSSRRIGDDRERLNFVQFISHVVFFCQPHSRH